MLPRVTRRGARTPARWAGALLAAGLVTAVAGLAGGEHRAGAAAPRADDVALPTSEWTPHPTATPTPQSTPTPTHTSTPRPVPISTPTPQPTPESTPHPTPEPTPTLPAPPTPPPGSSPLRRAPGDQIIVPLQGPTFAATPSPPPATPAPAVAAVTTPEAPPAPPPPGGAIAGDLGGSTGRLASTFAQPGADIVVAEVLAGVALTQALALVSLRRRRIL